MKKLILSSAFVAPLLMGVAVICAGSAETGYRLPGRAVNSTEASIVKGGESCSGHSIPCSNCGSGNMWEANNSKTGKSVENGCDSSCSVSSYSSAGCDG